HSAYFGCCPVSHRESWPGLRLCEAPVETQCDPSLRRGFEDSAPATITASSLIIAQRAGVNITTAAPEERTFGGSLGYTLDKPSPSLGSPCCDWPICARCCVTCRITATASS